METIYHRQPNRTIHLQVQIPLFDHATQMGGAYTAVSGFFTPTASGIQFYDRVTRWYQNFASDCIVVNFM